MKVSKEHASRHSETDFVNRFSMLVDSGAGMIHVRAQEVMRAALAVRKAVITDEGQYKEWDVVNGFREFDAGTLYNLAKEGDPQTVDIMQAFAAPLQALRESTTASAPKVKYFVYVNPHPFMENNPYLTQLVLAYGQMLPASNVCVVIITPDQPLPEAIGHQILMLRFDTPGLGELKESLTQIVSSVKGDFPEGHNVDDAEITRICYTGAGMALQHFESYASLSVVEAGRKGEKTLTADQIVSGVNDGKTEIVNQSDILELYPTANIDHIGGMENLKEWVRRRAACYSDEAAEFGVEPPKGMVFVGPPGTGKSVAAKSIAGVLGVPLVRLDFGRVFNSLVGASEQRIRTALRAVESMSPCVLFCDEIDKGLGGIANGSSGDSGVSMRVLGSFLTWLQDTKYPVFTMVTANNIDGLPPELMRRGRFDAIFSTQLPTPSERREVLRIHLALRGRNIEDFDEEEIAKVIDASNKYVPAEIESAIKDALIDAFSEGVDFSMEHVLAALVRMVPLSKAFAQQIERMSAWARDNATAASLTDDERNRTVAAVKNRSRVRAVRRGA